MKIVIGFEIVEIGELMKLLQENVQKEPVVFGGEILSYEIKVSIGVDHAPIYSLIRIEGDELI